mgnify:CR=1 FL=1
MGCGEQPGGCDERPGAPFRVLHLFSGDLWAGAEVMIYHLLSALRDQPGMVVTAMALNEGNLTARLRVAGIETIVVPESGRSFLSLCREVIRLCRNRRFDAVHAHRYKENVLAWVVAAAVGIPVRVSTIHGMPELYGGRRLVMAHLKARLNLVLLKKGFSTVVAVSQEIEQTLRRHYGFAPDRLVVIHNGIPVPEIDQNGASKGLEGRNARGLTIGTIGRCVPVKGFELFVEIAERVCRRIDGVTFALVGEGPEKAKLVELVKAKGLEGLVEFLPQVTDPTPYYRAFDVYMNTSLHEGVPLTILEAMAWGKPVVAARVGGIPEVVAHQETGFLVEGRDPDAYCAWCEVLARDASLRERIGERARSAVAGRFSVQKMALSYAAVYARHTSGAPTPAVECCAGHR